MNIQAKINKLYMLFVLLISLIGVSSFADSGNNGTCGAADTITAGTRMSGTVQNSNTDREDWYVFTVPSDGAVSIVYSSERDTNLYIGTNNCPGDDSYRVLNDGSSYNNTSSPIAVSQNDTVYIRIRENFGGSSNRTSWYNIDLTFTSGGGSGGYNFGSANFRPYTKININGEANTNINGDMVIIGNSQLECDRYISGRHWNNCNGAAPVDIPNNDIETQYSDYDGDASTFNSTRADVLTTGTVPVPADATVLWAGLYWQGRQQQSASDAVKTSGDTVKLKIPGGSYVPVTADTYNWISNNTNDAFDFQGFADITNIVNTSPHGQYWVADIQADEGTDSRRNRYGAWSIVFVYESPSKPLKNISVYDGYLSLYNNADNSNGIYSSINVPLSGFLTPTSGDIDSSFFIFAGEGDQAFTDGIWMDDDNSNRQPVTSTNNNDGNQINSTETSYGTNVTSRLPSHTNTIGIDIDTYNVGNVGTGHLDIISHSQTSTVFRLESHGDRYFPAVFAFSTDLYQPNICYFEEVFDTNGNSLQNGAEVTYGDDVNVKVYFLNEDNETAQQVHIWRTFETELPYHEETTSVDNSYDSSVDPTPNFTPVSDANDTDLLFFDIAGVSGTELTGQFQINLGTGADGTTGGDFVPGQESMMEYNATVNTDQNYTINYNITYLNPITGDLYNGQLTNKCTDFNNSFWGRRASATFVSAIDVVDVDEYATYSTEPVIKTKITEQPNVTLEAIYLDPNTGLETTYHDTVYNGHAPIQAIMYRSSDSTCSDSLPLAAPTAGSPSGEPVIANIGDGDSSGTTNSFTMEANASSTTYIQIVYADWNNILSGLANASSCFNNSNTAANFKGLPQCLNNLGSNSGISQDLMTAYPNIADVCLDTNNTYGGHNACDSNAYNNQGSVGDIQPERYNHAYGCFACILDAITDNTTCSTDGFAIRPEQFKINSTSMSYPDLLRAGQNYDLTIDAVNYASNTNTVDYNQTYGNLNIANPIKYYANGNSEINTTLLPGTASWGSEFNITNGYTTVGGVLGVAPYAYDEVGDITIHIEDANFAAIDNDDTPQTCDANGTKICGDQNATFIPHHFDVSATLVNRAGGNTFTYLSTDLNMSARYNVTITAENAAGATTTNFRMGALYYENPVSVHATAPTVTGVGAATVHDIEPAALLGFVDGVGGVLWNDTNASLQLSFNYPRTTNVPVNPFVIDGNQTTVDVNSTYTGTAGTADVNGTDLADANVTFVYGRAHMPRVRAMCSGGSCNGNMTFFFEFYGDKDANKTLITNLVGAPAPRSLDSVNWYRNTAHNTNTGDGNVTASITNILTATITYAPNGGTTSSAVYNYSGSQGYPYKGSITVDNAAGDTQSWLIYDKYNAGATQVRGELEYYGPGEWSSDTGAESTVQDKTDATRNRNTNRRIRW